MKVDGPNIGKYFLMGLFEGKIVSDTITNYMPEELINILEEFANEIYEDAHVDLYNSKVNFIEIKRMYIDINGKFESIGSDEDPVSANVHFHIDSNGNIDSLTMDREN